MDSRFPLRWASIIRIQNGKLSISAYEDAPEKPGRQQSVIGSNPGTLRSTPHREERHVRPVISADLDFLRGQRHERLLLSIRCPADPQVTLDSSGGKVLRWRVKKWRV